MEVVGAGMINGGGYSRNGNAASEGDLKLRINTAALGGSAGTRNGLQKHTRMFKT